MVRSMIEKRIKDDSTTDPNYSREPFFFVRSFFLLLRYYDIIPNEFNSLRFIP